MSCFASVVAGERKSPATATSRMGVEWTEKKETYVSEREQAVREFFFLSVQLKES